MVGSRDRRCIVASIASELGKGKKKKKKRVADWGDSPSLNSSKAVEPGLGRCLAPKSFENACRQKERRAASDWGGLWGGVRAGADQAYAGLEKTGLFELTVKERAAAGEVSWDEESSCRKDGGRTLIPAHVPFQSCPVVGSRSAAAAVGAAGAAAGAVGAAAARAAGWVAIEGWDSSHSND